MSSIKQKLLLCKITMALFVLDGCVPQQVATDIEYQKRMFQFHYVRRGDTLESVSKLYDMSEKDLIYINHLKSPYHLTSGMRLHVHKKGFTDHVGEVMEDPKLPHHIERDKGNLELTDQEDFPGPKKNRIPRTAHVVARHKGLGKLFVPLIAAGGALATLSPKIAFAAGPKGGTGSVGSGGSIPSGKTFPGGSAGKKITADPSDPPGNLASGSSGNHLMKKGQGKLMAANIPGSFLDGDGQAPIVMRSALQKGEEEVEDLLKETALPVLGLATGGLGLGAALISSLENHKKVPVVRTAAATTSGCCGSNPCFTWPVNNKGRNFVFDPKNRRIVILNTHSERYVRAASSGVISKIIAPTNTANMNMYTIIIDHSTPQCNSTYRSVYSGLVKIPDTITVGRTVNRDMVIGEIKPCCNDSRLFFQILDSGIPVKNTRRYLPGV